MNREFVIHNSLPELGNLIESFQAFCDENQVTEEVAYDIRLALEEAIVNIIKYGYKDRLSHQIAIRVAKEKDHMLIEIEDDAQPFNPLEAKAPDLSLPVDQRPIGGLGIYLMRTVMDNVEYERAAGKNILRLKKSC